MTFTTRLFSRSMIGVVLLLVGLAVTAAAIPLFTNVFPSLAANVPVLSVACGSTTLVSVPQAITPGSSGGVYFGCGSGSTMTGAAFTVAQDGAAVPTFTLPSPYVSVSLTNQPNNPFVAPTSGCSVATSLVLTSGQAFSFTGNNGKGNSYIYCLIFQNSTQSGLPTFSIAWTE